LSFKHGSNARVYVNGYDLSAYLKNFSISGEAETHDVTTFTATAKNYIAGLKDATLSADGVYDGDTGAVDEVIQAALGQDASIWTYFPQGETAVSDAGYGFDAIETSYEVETPVDDVAAVSAEAQSKTGLERVLTYHPLGQETESGNSTSIDNGSSSSNGGVGYLQVTGLEGAAPTLDITIQHSDDDGSTDPWSAICTFTQVTAANSSERKEVTGTIKRYTRAVWTFGGTITNATFSVAFGRK